MLDYNMGSSPLTMKKGLILGTPFDQDAQEVGRLLGSILEVRGFAIEMAERPSLMDDPDALRELDLLVPLTRGQALTEARERNLIDAVREGLGIATLGDPLANVFEAGPALQWPSGGRRVALLESQSLEVTVRDDGHPLTHGIGNFTVTGPVPCFHVDPAAWALASARVRSTAAPWLDDAPTLMAWTHAFGKGRVFFAAFGARAADFEAPEATELIKRGLLWAAR
jgi:type 1 glutamine amidotransferase